MGHFLECLVFVCNANTDFIKKILELDFLRSGRVECTILPDHQNTSFDHGNAGSNIGYNTFIVTQLVYRMFEFPVHKACPVTTGIVNLVENY